MHTMPFPSMQNTVKQISKNTRARLRQLPTFGGVRTMLWVALGLLLVAVVYLAQSSNAALLARSLSLKQERIAELERQNAQLNYEIAAATAPAMIEARVRKMGLGPAKNIVYVNLPPLQAERSTLPALGILAQSTAADHPPVAPVSTWNRVLALFGIDSGTDRVEAQSQ
jgi:cell division protein FtsB